MFILHYIIISTYNVLHMYGGATSGHYVYITNIKNQWYSISDEKVTKISKTEAFETLEKNATLIGYTENHEHKMNIMPQADTKINELENKSQNLKKITQSNPNKLSNIGRHKYKHRKIYIPKPENSYFDQDKWVFYVPKDNKQ